MIMRHSKDNARNILFTSFWIYTAIGAMLANLHSTKLQNPIGRTAVLVSLLGLLHTAGYSLYRNQEGWARLLPLLRTVFFQHAILFWFGSIILMSQLMQYITAMTCAYWAMVAIIITRRPQLSRRSDLLIVRYGFPTMLISGFAVLDLLAQLHLI